MAACFRKDLCFDAGTGPGAMGAPVERDGTCPTPARPDEECNPGRLASAHELRHEQAGQAQHQEEARHVGHRGQQGPRSDGRIDAEMLQHQGH